MLRLGHKQHGRAERIAAKKKAVGEILRERDNLIGTAGRQLGEAYWIAEPEDIIALNLQQLDRAHGQPLSVEAQYYPARGATLVTVMAADHPGCSTASRAASTWPAATSSTRASTPRATVRRSTTSWCRTRLGVRSAKRRRSGGSRP
jgi:hypothetical protein